MSKRSDPQLIAIIAADSRNRSEQERAFIVGQISKKILRHFLRPKGGQYEMLIKDSESDFEAFWRVAKDAGVDQEILIKAQLEAVIKLLGDPYTLWYTRMHLHHQIPYVNPCAVKLNVFPLGLPKPDENGKPTKEVIDFVQPGEIIYVPQPHTVGGKYSTLRGVAPQLVPCPRIEDEELDLQPTTYAEWCTHRNGSILSECCNKGVVWSEQLRRLVCAKCGERVKGY